MIRNQILLYLIGFAMHAKNRDYVLIFFSAILLAVAYCATFAWFLCYFFLIPIAYLFFKSKHVRFRQGFCWGLVFWAIHYHAINQLFVLMGHGWGRILGPIALVVYSSLYAGLWFFAIGLIPQRTTWQGIILIAACTFGYFWLTTQHMFLFFDYDVGYCFGYPSMLLAQQAGALFFLPLLGGHTFLFIFILSQIMWTRAFISPNRWTGITACGGLMFLIFGFLTKSDHITAPADLAMFGYIQPSDFAGLDAQECAAIINEKITVLSIRNPSIHYFILPESAFPFYLNLETEAIDIWRLNALNNNQHLLIGAYSMEHGRVHNSFYHIQKSRIINRYDKRTRFPFFEFVPSLFCFAGNIFFKSKPNFSYCMRPAQPFVLGQSRTVCPLICSDLFFTIPSGSGIGCHPLICIINDSWFYCLYMKRLMKLYAHYVSTLLRRDIIYVSHTYGCWIRQSTSYPLSKG